MRICRAAVNLYWITTLGLVPLRRIEGVGTSLSPWGRLLSHFLT